MSRGSPTCPRRRPLPARVAALAAGGLLAGCGGSSLGDRREPPPDPPPPEIAAFAVDCDVDSASWTLTARATAWSGGGVAVLSRDLQYVEEHLVRVAESAPDGSRDDLELVLGIVGDWRAQTPGSSTVFTCAQAPSVVFTLRAIDGAAADCALYGDQAEQIASLPEVDCPSGEAPG